MAENHLLLGKRILQPATDEGLSHISIYSLGCYIYEPDPTSFLASDLAMIWRAEISSEKAFGSI